VLERNLGERGNVAIVPFALGEREGSVLMGIPGEQPYRHGLTRVLDEGEQGTTGHHFEVRIRPPQQLFGDLERLDYIKCDVEGYEHHVLPPMEEHIRRFRPIVQVELAPENRAVLFDLFAAADYRAFFVQDQQLHELPDAATPAMGDVLFIPSEKIAALAELTSAAPRSR
jgi:FkbM family methyltransferase